MPQLLRSKKAIDRVRLRQDFHPHERSNGQIIYVSDDFRFYYIPMY